MLSFSFKADAFVSDEQVESLLNTIPTYVNAAESVKKEKKAKLKAALDFACSVSAVQAFWDSLNQNWDRKDSIEKKEKNITQAKEQALTTAKKRLEELASLKSESGRFSLARVLHEAMPGTEATDYYYERDKFIDKEGKLDFRIAEFGLNSSLPLEQRQPADLIYWADSHLADTPEVRMKQLEALRSQPRVHLGGSSSFWNGSYHSSVPIGTCGAPSSQAGALRPELNGQN